jgi:hypothetical protein
MKQNVVQRWRRCRLIMAAENFVRQSQSCGRSANGGRASDIASLSGRHNAGEV